MYNVLNKYCSCNFILIMYSLSVFLQNVKGISQWVNSLKSEKNLIMYYRLMIYKLYIYTKLFMNSV